MNTFFAPATSLDILLQKQSVPFVFDEDAEALFLRFQSEPSSDRKLLMNTVFVDLKTAAVFEKLDWLCFLAAHDEDDALLNWMPGSKAVTREGTTTFTVDRGISADGSTGYISFGETFSASPNLFALNAAHTGAYCNQDTASGGVAPHIGDLTSPSPRMSINAARGGGIDNFRANDATNTNAGAARTSRTGHRISNRTSSTGGTFYRDGSLLHTSAVTSVGLGTGFGTALRAGALYCGDRLAVVHSGGGLSGTDVSNLTSIVSTYLTAIGGAV